MTAITTKTLATARRIARLADEGGTIQAADMRRVSRDPRHHTATSLRDAWAIALPGVDADALAEALWA